MNDPLDASFERIRLMLAQHRYADAEHFAREALSQRPTDGEMLHLLAIALLHQEGRASEALDVVNAAIAQDPGDAFYHAVKTHILLRLDRNQAALETAEGAVGMQPDVDAAWKALAAAHAAHRDWASMEVAARKALELDADDIHAANQLAHALRLQNKQSEAAAHVEATLARDPEDAGTHATAGWAALQRGETRVAETHFREALRLEPDMESAREGLIEAFKARSPLYRMYLSYTFFMQRFSRRAQWALVIGLVVGNRVLKTVLVGPARWIGAGLGMLYLLFVLWLHFASGIGSFMLLTDRFARLALRRNEKIEAVMVGGGVAMGVLLVVLSLLVQAGWLLIAGGSLIAAAVPFAHTFTNDSRAGRWVFGAIGTFMLLAGVLDAMSPVLPQAYHATISGLFAFALLAVIISTWLPNLRVLKR